MPTLVVTPSAGGPHPAVVIGVEAYGPNPFTTGVATRLAEGGHVVVAPDYYRGHGPSDAEAYTDFAEVKRFIDALDFRRGTRDLLTAVAHAAGRDDVDPDRIAVWGYCTGGTLALLAAELSDRIAAAVPFFPWPRPEARRELASGEEDGGPSTAVGAALPRAVPLRRPGRGAPARAPGAAARPPRHAGDRHRLAVYPGAGHAFCAPVPPMRDDAADRASWSEATAFLARHLGAGAAAG